MTTVVAATEQPHIAARRRLARLTAMVLAVAATLAVWVVATAGFDVDLRAPAFGDAGENPAIGAGTVAVTTAVGGLAAWAVLALIERVLRARARRVWTVVAVLALLVSLGGPLSGTGVGDVNRLVLVLMHVVAAAVLIPLLTRSSDRGSAGGAGR